MLNLDVQQWIMDIGLSDHCNQFKRSDGQILLSLTEEDFKKRFGNDVEAAQVAWNSLITIIQDMHKRLRSLNRYESCCYDYSLPYMNQSQIQPLNVFKGIVHLFSINLNFMIIMYMYIYDFHI